MKIINLMKWTLLVGAFGIFSISSKDSKNAEKKRATSSKKKLTNKEKEELKRNVKLRFEKIVKNCEALESLIKTKPSGVQKTILLELKKRYSELIDVIMSITKEYEAKLDINAIHKIEALLQARYKNIFDLTFLKSVNSLNLTVANNLRLYTTTLTALQDFKLLMLTHILIVMNLYSKNKIADDLFNKSSLVKTITDLDKKITALIQEMEKKVNSAVKSK